MKTLMTFMLTLCSLSSAISQAIEIKVRQASNFKKSDLVILDRAVKLAQKAVNTQTFKERVLNFEYEGQRQFVQNNGYSNAQIIEKIQEGAEIYPVETAPNQTLDLYLQLWFPRWSRTSTIAYTLQSTKTVFINANFFRYAEDYEIAMNLVHEWTHKLGFEHDSNNTYRRNFSVPYGIGSIVREIAGQIQSGKEIP